MLDLVAVREGGTVADALHIALRTAQHAESLGFTRYWLAEHHNMPGIASSATAVLGLDRLRLIQPLGHRGPRQARGPRYLPLRLPLKSGVLNPC